MPAWKLTASCIGNSFRTSGKKHLLLTGSKHSGKTTLLKKLVPQTLPGICTFAVPGQSVTLAENSTDNRATIGVYCPDCTPPMRTEIDGFKTLGVRAIERCITSDSAWVSVDEIGFLESACPEYCDALLRLFDRKQVLAVVRKQNLPFLNALLAREDVFVIDMDEPFGKTGCVIMASGEGKRFGENKLMADFHGQPLIAGVLAATELLTDRVVVTRHADVADYCRKREIPVLLHSLPYRNDTIRLGLDAMQNMDSCLFCPGDQPLLTAETVQSLALLGLNKKDTVIRPVAGTQPGAPILFPKKHFPDLYALPQGKGGNFFLAKHPECVCPLPLENADELSDVDTKDELSELLRRCDK